MSETARGNITFTSEEMKRKCFDKAEEHGFSSFSNFVEVLCLNADINIKIGVDPSLKQIEDALNLFEKGFINRDEFNHLKNLILKGDGYKALKEVVKK